MRMIHFLVLNVLWSSFHLPVHYSNTIANFIKGYYVSKLWKPASSHVIRLLIEIHLVWCFCQASRLRSCIVQTSSCNEKSIEKTLLAWLVKGACVLSPKGDYCPDCAWCGLHYHKTVAKGVPTHLTKLSRLMEIFTPSRYSFSYWANSSDTSAFSHIGFSLLGDGGGSLDDGTPVFALPLFIFFFYHPFLGAICN